MLKGLDLNHWRVVNNFNTLVDLGHKFFITKATEGTTFLDNTLYPNVESSKRVKLLTGAYHYLRTTVDPTQQANFYWDKIKNLDLEINPILDVEPYSNNIAILGTYAQTFLNRIKVLSGKTPIIYTNYNTWNLLKFPTWGINYPLWVASYQVSKPYIPKPWTNYLFWQYTSTEPIRGEAQTYDCNYFNGTENELRAFFGLPPVDNLEVRVKILEDKVKLLMDKLGM